MSKRRPKFPVVPTEAPSNAVQKLQSLKIDVTQLIENAVQSTDLLKEQLEEIQTSPITETKLSLGDAVQQALQARKIYELSKENVESHRSEIAQERAVLTQREQEIVSREVTLEQLKSQLAEREATLNDLARDLQELKIQAENGFADIEIARRRIFEAEMEKRRLANQEDYLRRLAENESLKNALIAKFEALSAESQQKSDHAARTLEQRERRLLEAQEKIRDQESELETQLMLFKSRAHREVNTELAQLRVDLELTTAHRDTLTERVDQLEGELRTLRVQARRFDGMSSEQAAHRLNDLESENRQLREELLSRPGQDTLERYQALENRLQNLVESETAARAEQARITRELARRNVEATTVEGLRDENRALKLANETHRSVLRELETTVDKYLRKNDEKAVFPACAGMDANTQYQTVVNTSKQELDLCAFVSDMQVRMASFSQVMDRRSYQLSDLRAFTAGLAMSRLHLLQGISGTGKTSLPQAFARAMAGGLAPYATIEVQAGWRDRADLLGTYNAFEGRFYESEFLKALYMARTPRHREMPFFIILDEMNLSQPEQYFADLLSVLEQRESERRIRLTSAPVGAKPLGLNEDAHGGLYLPLPGNVWFIGTANHDETTKDFADKTYDRSHIMDLPRRPERVDPKKLSEREPIDHQQLLDAFQDAQDTHASKADKAKEFLQTSKVADMLRDRFDLAWGNRLERQIDAFVPVIVASGGTVSEALDHIMATKLLRKLVGRYDLQVQQLRDLSDEIELAWIDYEGEPIQSRVQLNKVFRSINAPIHESALDSRA